MEVPAGQIGVQGLSAGAILAVAEGLRWTDPQLSVALAEHVARAAGADAGARTAAERSAVLALGQSDRAAELIVRALPHLRDAEREGRVVDAGTLRCELSLAALRCGDTDAAERLLEPLAAGRVLPPAVRADALVAWAAARASRGDVAGVDAAGRQVDDLVGETADDARRLAIRRARAEARWHGGDTAGALEILRVAVSDAQVGDGGRQAALLLADRVELLAGLGRRDEAREAGTPALAEPPRATTSLALGRLRCVLAQHVHLPAGEFETAERLAREAEADLAARGHEAQVAVAVEVLAAVAEGRGDARQALAELRRARPHVTAAHGEATRARAALAAALAGDDERLPATAVVEDRASSTTGDDADGRWASAAPDQGGPPDVADADSPQAGPKPQAGPGVATASALDALAGAVAPAPARASSDAGERTASAPEPDPDATPAAPRRRNRYRVHGDPGELLAAALAAARGEFDAFSTAPASPDPSAGDAIPETAPERSDPRDDSPDDRFGEVADDPDAVRRRRLARARARWETSESLLPRRDDPLDAGEDDGPGHRARRDGDERARLSGPARGARRPVDEDEPGHGDGRDGRDDGWHDGWHDGGRAVDDRHHRDESSSLDGARTGVSTAAGDRARPGAARSAADDRTASDQSTNGLGTMGPGANGLGGSGLGANGPGGNVLGGNGRPAGPGGADDELARELALTLVDLLSEYGDVGVPLGGGLGTTPVTPTPAPARDHASAGARGDRPAGVPRATSARSTASSIASTSSASSRTREPRGTRSGVPSARRADDAGPRLADLLADAMDAYHSAGPGPDDADDRRARR